MRSGQRHDVFSRYGHKLCWHGHKQYFRYSLGIAIDGSEITDGSVANGDLANSSVTILAGSGLATGGAVALGGTVTLDIGAGNGIVVNANDVAIDSTTSGTTVTTSSNSGIEVTAAGLRLLGGCSDTQILKWSSSSSVWACNSDSTAPAADTLDFTELRDNLSLDAATTISLGANNLNINLDSTGDVLFQDNGTAFFTLTDTGNLLFKNTADNAAAFQIQKSGSTTNLFVVDTQNNRVYIGDVAPDTTGTLLVLDTKSNSADPGGINGGMYYNSAANKSKFRCYQNNTWEDCISRQRVYLPADVTNITTTIANVTGLSFPVTSGINYTFECRIKYTAAATGTGSRWSISGPASPTYLSYDSTYSLTATSNTFNNAIAYDIPAASNASSANTNGNTALIKGFITPSANGTVTVRFASEGAANPAITARAGSMCEYWSQ